MDNLSFTSQPVVSIITPTYKRHDELRELIHNILKQTHKNIEHVIVSDGDPNVRWLLEEEFASLLEPNPCGYRIKFAECGRNWSTFLPDSYTAIPLMTATALASGDYHMWMSDDERMLVSDHIEKLLNPLVHEKEIDFSYSRVILEIAATGQKYVIGKDAPAYGHITHCMYKVELLKRGMYRPFVGSAGDWDVISRWMSYGAKWKFIDEITFYHKADK